MDRVELMELLTREGVAQDAYVINVGPDAPTSEVDLNERSVLGVENGGWVVYYAERGQRSGVRWHESEDEACRDVLERLLRDPTARVDP